MSRARPTARQAAQRALSAFDRNPNARLNHELDTRGLSTKDRALARELAYGVVRRLRLLDHVILGLAHRGLPKDPRVTAALRIGAYQLLFLERVPAHAAVDESVRLVAPKSTGFVNAVLRRIAESVRSRPADPSRPRSELPLAAGRCAELVLELPDPERDWAGHQALIAGLPAFLVERWRERFGTEETVRIAVASNTTPGVHLRAVRATGSDLAARLRSEAVETEPTAHPRLVRWTGGALPFDVAAFRDGALVIQDPTAVRAAEAVGAVSGESVLDLCAAPGTKATLLAEAVGPGGRVFAHDIDAARRRLVVENAVRLGLPWLGVIDSLDGLELVDRALVDVPCSNTGVLARRPEVRHRLRPTLFAELATAQERLLRAAVAAVRPGGTVVYATCSVETEENDAVVDAVARDGAVEVEARVLTLPNPPDRDGGYHAVLRRPV